MLRGKGMPYAEGDGVLRGDLYVFMRVRLPPVPSTDEEKAAFVAWAAARRPPAQTWEDVQYA